MRELLLAEGVSPLELPTSRSILVKDLLRLLISDPAYTLKSLSLSLALLAKGVSLRGIVSSICFSALLPRLLAVHNARRVHLETGPGKEYLLAGIIGRCGIPDVLYPHNIEKLVPYQRSRYFVGRASIANFETQAFRRAAEVVTISEYDAKAVRGLGVSNVSVLPYYPPAARMTELVTVRQGRKERVQSFFLSMSPFITLQH